MKTVTFSTHELNRQDFIRNQISTFAVLLLLFMPFLKNAHPEVKENRNPRECDEHSSEKSNEEHSGLIEKALGFILQKHQVKLIGEPHTIQLLPIVYYDPGTGFNFGFRSIILNKKRNPYHYRLTVQVLASTKASHNHKLNFRFPKINHSNLGLLVRAGWRRDLKARYFGLGNQSLNEKKLTDPKSTEFIDEDFYLYNLKRLRLTLYGTYEIIPAVQFWFGFGLQQVEPQLKNGEATSFLARDRPFGYLGGSGKHLSFRLSWDTRTDDVFPSEGFLTEFSFEPNFANVNEEINLTNESRRRSKEVTFYRYTFSDAHFYPLIANRLIFANRVAFEAITGDAPYYAFGEIVGQRYTHCLGGSQSLRGYETRRFQDKIKLFTLTELRLQAKSFEFISQKFDLIFIGFFDTGRVWHYRSEIKIGNFHKTFGAGIWLNWNKNLIFRLDIGKSKEGILPYFRLNTAF